MVVCIATVRVEEDPSSSNTVPGGLPRSAVSMNLTARHVSGSALASTVGGKFHPLTSISHGRRTGERSHAYESIATRTARGPAAHHPGRTVFQPPTTTEHTIIWS